MLAYLVIRDGAKWSEVFRLAPGRLISIGRGQTNDIVVKDMQASRRHAEIFPAGDNWVIRDLNSHNGTIVGEAVIDGDVTLAPGDVIRIAKMQIAFVHDLSRAFTDSATISDDDGEATVIASNTLSNSSVLEDATPTTITHRRNKTRLLHQEGLDEEPIPKLGRDAARLCRLAFDLARQPDIEAAANAALEGLFEHISIDAGAILLARKVDGEGLVGENLDVIASRSDLKPRYHRVSSFIAQTVLRDGEAVLARNVASDSTLGSRDSKGDIHTTSVICAPIRRGPAIVGFIHLYSTVSSSTPTPDDLEFTLAVADNIALALANLQKQQELTEHLHDTRSEVADLRKQLGVESEIVGNSVAMQRVHQDIAQVAPVRTTVLVRGESGSGKELVARAIHFSSPRKNGPFVCLNCAALTESLLESELFGHEKGAFTGATDRKVGKFEAADKGTLMLDEIGEMSPTIQAKFLRVLEGHPFERVGGSKPITSDVRVIAATNRNLQKAVEQGEFRRDLYFRLKVVDIFVAPLRKRPEDIIELAHYFLDRFRNETGRKVEGLTKGAINALQQYRWPGNVRELKNVMERAVLLTRSEYIDTGDLALISLSTASESGELTPPRTQYEPVSLADLEKQHILATLRANDWNKSQSARILGIERSTLDRKLSRYQVKRPEDR